MTGRNPWVVLCVAEDAPYTEVQRAFRRRVKQTHPDSGGDAGEFATVVRAFADVRHGLRPERRAQGAVRPTPYDGWLRPYRPVRSWTEDIASLSVVPDGAAGGVAAMSWPGNDFSTVLRNEMARAGAAAAR